MDFPPILGGMAAGVGANEIQRKVDKHLHGDIPDEHLFGKLHQAITELRTELKTITQYIADTRLPPEDILVQVQPAPWSFRLFRKDRRYNMIFLPNNTTQLTFNIPGLGNVNFTPPLGWTELNFPPGTEVSSASGTPSFIYRVTNIPLGSSVI